MKPTNTEPLNAQRVTITLSYGDWIILRDILADHVQMTTMRTIYAQRGKKQKLEQGITERLNAWHMVNNTRKA